MGGGGWTGIRDTLESAASLAGNYLLPGSSLATNQLVSKGAQKQLSTPLGKVASIGSGLAGGGVGKSFTGIPSASDVGAGWTNLGNAVGGIGGAPTLGTDIANTANSAWNSVTGAVDTGGATGMANPDINSQFNLAGTAAPGVGAGAAATAAPASATGLTDITSGLNFEDSFLGAAGDAAQTATSGGASTIPTGFLDIGKQAATALGGANEGNTILNAIKGTGSIGDVLKANANLAIPAAGLAYSAYKGNQPLPGQSENEGIANSVAAQSAELRSYLSSGQLPPGLQSKLMQDANAAKAAIRSRYASMGLSGSSSERQELGAVDTQVTAQRAEMARSLLETGIGEANLASNMYNHMSQQALQEDEALGNSIANFASAAGGHYGGKRINFEDLLRGGSY